MNGWISTEFTVWCGKCHSCHQESTPNKIEAVEKFKRHGWKLKKAYGWTCPNCVSEEKRYTLCSICADEGKEIKSVARGMCMKHFKRHSRHGDARKVNKRGRKNGVSGNEV
ncbi:hypothetical protein [Paenibacillus alvei]|uniref:hypothetical protein n=1 Tax=Paenibacillus alvei TaxID=44250 RepID=UPI0022817E85|nr:hypothetical protein [Paenibacillus alvei]MCY7487923.1 hypothetical protein [Paenibacillus alvei]